MKRLLVLMLCAALAIPAVGMNVQASGSTEKIAGVAKEINEYYASKNFTESGKNNADDIMDDVAEDLDYEYIEGVLKKKDDFSGREFPSRFLYCLLKTGIFNGYYCERFLRP